MSNHLTVRDIETVEAAGPWQSKSGGNLTVALKLPRDKLDRFLDYDNPAFDEIGEDIRGLRMYTVDDIPKDSVGGKEWHKIRTEFITAIAGTALLECVDLDGEEREFILDGKTGVIIPPKTLHTYKALEDGTSLQVVANTLFVPDDPSTHDTYTVDDFDL